ncbi:MAG: ABC transporter permease [Bacteroidales bacterium]|nr:ABC transporter permease [Bacteroidales bacterium]
MNILKLFKYNLLLFVREKQNLLLLTLFPVIIYLIIGESFRYLVPAIMSGENIVIISEDELPTDYKSYLSSNFSIKSFETAPKNKNNVDDIYYISKQIKKGFQVININYKKDYIDLKLYTVKGYEFIFNPLIQKINLQVSTYKKQEMRFKEETLKIKIPNFAIFIFPGIIIMSILNTCLFGIGTELANFREKGILKRLFITPIRIDTFLTSYLLSRFLLIILQVLLIFVVNKFLFKTGLADINIYSLCLMLFLTTILATLMGFLIFSISNSFSSAVSLSNYISMPMLFFSGAFFPVDSSPIFSKLSLIIPITPTVNLLRSIMIYNDSFGSYVGQFALIVFWICLFSIISLYSWKIKNKQLI